MFYHDLAKRAAQGTAEAELEELHKSYISFRQYHLESFLCRLHDIVKKYFEELLQEILLSRAGFFEESGPSAQSNEVQKVLADARKISSKSIVEVVEFVAAKLDESSLGSETERNFVKALGAVRNIIVHNDAVPDQRFLDRLANAKFDYKLRFGTRVEIDEPWLLAGAGQCDHLVFSFDQKAIERTNLPTRNRFGWFWMR